MLSGPGRGREGSSVTSSQHRAIGKQATNAKNLPHAVRAGQGREALGDREANDQCQSSQGRTLPVNRTVIAGGSALLI